MKRHGSILGVLAACLALAGCQLPQISQQDIDNLTAAVQQAQQAYEQLKPVIEQLKPLAEQYLKDDETVGTPPASGPRAAEWSLLRDSYARMHPWCAVCGAAVEQVHHIRPFSAAPDRELDPDNLIGFCRRDHFVFGHLGDWKACNPDVRSDAAEWQRKFLTRKRTGGDR